MIKSVRAKKMIFLIRTLIKWIICTKLGIEEIFHKKFLEILDNLVFFFICLIDVLNFLKHRVGLEEPTIEVHFEHLNVEAEAHVGSRALPTIFNFCVNMLEVNEIISMYI